MTAAPTPRSTTSSQVLARVTPRTSDSPKTARSMRFTERVDALDDDLDRLVHP